MAQVRTGGTKFPPCVVQDIVPYRVRGPIGEKKERKKERTSRPKARDGHRYPCPAEQFVYGSLLGKQGFGPEGGRSPVEHRGNLYVRTKSPETAAERPEPAP